MRSELIDNYYTKIMHDTGGDDGPMHEVFSEIYYYSMDNRIFNNLKQQLNELIEDERSLISVVAFAEMFKMYFKAEIRAEIIYKKMLPFITVYSMTNQDVFDDLPEHV